MKMKINGNSLAICLMLVGANAVSATDSSVATEITSTRVFTSPIEWIGERPPPETESAQLLQAIGVFERRGIKAGFEALEAFLTTYPDSAWAPWLHEKIAGEYRIQGRYTPALAHWESAWSASKDRKEANAQKIAVRAIAGWSSLLGSLGQKEKLSSLLSELDRLQLPLGAHGTAIEAARESLATMNTRPEVSYRCGSFALAHVAQAKGLGIEVVNDLFQVRSPDGGFRASELLTLAQNHALPMIVVRRPAGAQLIVPSVIHWKLNHYAAIVEQKGGRYRVLDPTFGGYLWMDIETIASEASGIFLVPKETAPADWQQLTGTDCAAVRGKGATSDFTDNNDTDPDECNVEEDDTCDPPCANDGPTDGDDCCSEAGMPKWRVSEPYITLWLQDVPMQYRLSSGKWMRLKLSYKHRGAPKDSTLPSFGSKWECNWLGMLQTRTNMDVATNYVVGGGLRGFAISGVREYQSGGQFQPNCNNFPASAGGGGGGYIPPQFNCNSLLSTLALNSPRDGWSAYSFSVGTLSGTTNYLLTHRVDRYGRTTVFNYQTISSVARMTSLVDRDGRANILVYAHPTFSNLITAVTNPYGASVHFTYDSLGRLTNIVDTLGLSSSFQYDGSDNITNMITPYGTNSFEYFANLSSTNLAGGRTLLVTEASGDKQLYMFKSQSVTMRYTYDGGDETACPDCRNSFHWNRSQYAAISAQGKTNFLLMPDADYSVASIKHWLHETSTSIAGNTLDSSAGPVDPSNGNHRSGGITYEWQGQSGFLSMVANSLRRVTKIWVNGASGDPDVAISRNENGRPTVFTYRNKQVGGSLLSTATYSNIYDPSGRHLREVFGPRGERVRGYGYDTTFTNLLISVTNAANEVTRYTHDSTNGFKVTSITFPGGLVRTKVYYTNGPSQGFLLKETDEGFSTRSFGYTDGNLTTETNELGLVTTYLYDKLNRLVNIAYPDGTSISNLYNKLDLVGVKDRLDQWTRYGYNPVRQLVAETNVNGQVTLYDYCGCGSSSQITRYNGSTPVITQFQYDMAGRLTNTIHPDGYQISHSYNLLNLPNDVRDGSGHRLSMIYSQYGLQTKLRTAYRGPLGGERKLLDVLYDEYGRITNSLDRNEVTTVQSYDVLNRVLSRRFIGYDGTTMTGLETFGYDAVGLNRHTNALGFVTAFVRDALGRVLFETNANNEVLRFTYNAADQLLTLDDGKNQVTAWNYDTFGRTTDKVDATSTEIFRYQYDPLDRLTNRWSAAKGNTTFKYDARGNLTNIVYPVSSNIVLRYDTLNRLTNMVNGVGSTRFTWTAGNQLATEDGPWSYDTVSYTYNQRLRSTMSLAQPNASDWVQTYTYDDFLRLAALNSPAGKFGYTNRDIGTGVSDRLYKLGLPGYDNTLIPYIENQYDPLGRLTDTRMHTYLQTYANEHQYAYDLGSQRTQQVFQAGNYVNYSYDPIGQLTKAVGFESGGTTNRLHEQFGYGYDAAWNLVQRTNHMLVQTFNVNSLNELTNVTRSSKLTVVGTTTSGATNVTVNGATAILYSDCTFASTNHTLVDGNNTFTAIGKDATDGVGRKDTNVVTVYLPATNAFVYDLNGNLRTNGTRIFEYDDENQLIRITEPSGWKSEFSYDGMLRRRIRQEFTWQGGTWVKTNEVRYLYDGMLVVQERDERNVPLVSYTRGNDLSGTLQEAGGIGGLLARTDHSMLAVQPLLAHAYYHCDGNGNVTELVATNGAVLARYSYDPYGNILSKSGPWADANLYRFSSKEFQRNSGLYYYGFRFYEPNLQRWLNRDPLGLSGGVNLYRFVSSNPVNGLDHFGLLCPNPSAVRVAVAAEAIGGGPANPISDIVATVALVIGSLWVSESATDQAPVAGAFVGGDGRFGGAGAGGSWDSPDPEPRLHTKYDRGSKDDYADAWEDCSQAYREYYNEETCQQRKSNPEMIPFKEFMDGCMKGKGFKNDGPP